MNEVLFLLHTLLVTAFGLGALRMGKEALTVWVALQAVLANLFVIKQIDLLGFHVTCSDVFAVGSLLGINLLREYFGKETGKKALWICFFTMGFFAAMAQLHLLYQPNTFDNSQAAFDTLLSPSPRLLVASIGVFFIVQWIDLYLFSYLREKLPRASLSVRNALSLSATQLLDTILFSFLGLWGLVANLVDIVLLSFAVKLLAIWLMSPLLQFSRHFVPKTSENPSK